MFVSLITLQSADIVAPEPCLLREGNVAGVQVQRHRGQVSEGVSVCNEDDDASAFNYIVIFIQIEVRYYLVEKRDLSLFVALSAGTIGLRSGCPDLPTSFLNTSGPRTCHGTDSRPRHSDKSHHLQSYNQSISYFYFEEAPSSPVDR